MHENTYRWPLIPPQVFEAVRFSPPEKGFKLMLGSKRSQPIRLLIKVHQSNNSPQLILVPLPHLPFSFSMLYIQDISMPFFTLIRDPYRLY